MRCQGCAGQQFTKAGRDRAGRQVHCYSNCGHRQTARSASAFSGYRFPPDVIALAVRWYLRYRLSYADVAELLAERGVHVDPSSIYDWVQAFTPLYKEAARAYRRPARGTWAIDETYIKVGGVPMYVFRAIDEHGQVVDIYVSPTRCQQARKLIRNQGHCVIRVGPEGAGVVDCGTTAYQRSSA